jgi:phospholipid/cholesterol/gamma-HCH transport system ATP-binding protein
MNPQLELDELILNLKETLGLTVVVVTHDLDSLWAIADKVAFLGEGKVLAEGSMKELIESEVPQVQEYFNGPRGRITTEIYREGAK